MRNPGEESAEAWMDMRDIAQSARPELLAALAGVGVQPDDFELIEQARSLVDEVNARLRRRGSHMIYTITFCTAVPAGEIDLPDAVEVSSD
jgi:hypothetical protein